MIEKTENYLKKLLNDYTFSRKKDVKRHIKDVLKKYKCNSEDVQKM